MGGRGAVSNLSITRTPEVIERKYEVITRASLVGQASYAFLDQLGRNWTVITRDAEEGLCTTTERKTPLSDTPLI